MFIFKDSDLFDKILLLKLLLKNPTFFILIGYDIKFSLASFIGLSLPLSSNFSIVRDGISIFKLLFLK
jgi:hypothetical protein